MTTTRERFVYEYRLTHSNAMLAGFDLQTWYTGSSFRDREKAETFMRQNVQEASPREGRIKRVADIHIEEIVATCP